ncbi:MAG: TonB-dependent receptor [Cyanobacteria bacterium P01_B01_bin.77]
MNKELCSWPMLAGIIALMIHPAAAAETVGQRLENPLNEALTKVQFLAQGDRVDITNIQVEESVTGVNLQLIANEKLTVAKPTITGNSVIVNVANAVLQLQDGDEFLVDNPADGIGLINVTNLPDSQVQIVVTGTDAAPTLEISTATTGIFVGVIPGMPTVQASEDDALRIVVTSEGKDDYFIPNASTATRTDTPLRDIPNSIQVIPRQVIEDQQAIALEEVLRNAAGVTFQGDDDGRDFRVGIRGFDGAPILRDGFRQFGFGANSAAPEVANLERIEVLRGPASVLYGESEPGGVINLVTKKPLSEPYYNFQFQAGNRGLISPSIDLSGPLTDDGRLLYRLNAVYREEDSFQDYDSGFNRFFIGPTLSWLISDQTKLTFNLEYTRDDDPYVSGLAAIGDSVADIPLDRVLGNPDDTINQEYLNVGYTLEHDFSDSWQLRNEFRYSSDEYAYGVFPLRLFLDESTGDFDRLFAGQVGDTETYSIYTNVQGEFNTGSVKHKLLFGVDFAHTEESSRSRATFEPEFFTTINIFDPEYSIAPTSDANDIPLFFGNDGTTDHLGIYLQDQIDILDNLILVAGLRYDSVDSESVDFDVDFGDFEFDQYDDSLTPRIGIVYQPIEPISLYANYSRSFVPNTGTDVDGNLFDPTEGEGFEVGIKGEIIENRLAATLAYFDITKQNVLTTDPNDPFSSVSTGEQNSQGIDFNVTGEILPGWNIVASYAYIDAEVTEDNTDIVGNRLFNIPEHSASLWTTYEIQSGDLQGLGFGLGFNFVGERQGDLENSFEVDSYFLTNAAVFYRQNNWRLGLNFDNLFDINYIESTDNLRFNSILPGDPFTVRASVSYTF